MAPILIGQHNTLAAVLAAQQLGIDEGRNTIANSSGF